MISIEIRESLAKSSWIRKMFEEGEKLKKEYGEEKVFDFTLGNPYGNPPDEFYSGLIDILSSPEKGMHSYMPNAGYQHVREAKAGELIKLTGREFTPGHVVMTAGAAGGLNVALRALMNPGEEFIILSPYFVEYIFYAGNFGAIPIVVPTTEIFEPDLDGIAKSLSHKTRAIIINTPNNPTGKVYGEDVLSGLGELLERHERKMGIPVYAISDEPYREVLYGESRFVSPARFIRNCLVVYSNSKDLNIPGERIGYAAISPDATGSNEIFEALVFANRTLGFVNAPALMQRISARLTSRKADMATYDENRGILIDIFERWGVEFSNPEGAFYFFPRIPRGMDEPDFVKFAREKMILLVPGGGFGTSGYFRVAFCTSKDVVRRSEEAWDRLFEDLGVSG